MNREIYLDHAATTPVRPEVLEVMLPYFSETYGNPSSLYSAAQKSKEAIEDSRRQISSVLGCRPNEIVFTSGGTESDNAAIKGVALAMKDDGNHIVTSSIEHHAVLDTCHFLEKYLGFDVTYLPVDEYGLVSPEVLDNHLTEQTVLVSIMHANNEIGTIQPISDLSAVVKAHGESLNRSIPFHTDAVQSAGYLDLNVEDLGVDLMSLSAHKIYGPKGIGVLYLRQNTPFVPLQSGGGQERGLRSGTENVSAIVGMGTALELASNESKYESERCRTISDQIIQGLLSVEKAAQLNGHPFKRLPNNVNILFPNIDGEMIVVALNQLGISASTGSACSTGSLEPSHVLQAIGISREDSWGSLRLSVGKYSHQKEVSYVVSQILKAARGTIIS